MRIWPRQLTLKPRDHADIDRVALKRAGLKGCVVRWDRATAVDCGGSSLGVVAIGSAARPIRATGLGGRCSRFLIGAGVRLGPGAAT
jgi:hypothetical protein